MPFVRKSFLHEIRKHIVHRTIFHTDRSFLDMVSDKAELNIDIAVRAPSRALVSTKDDFWHIL